MSDSPFELNVDSDWKKQAQAEKRRLAEEAEKNRQAATPAAAPAAGAPGGAGAAADAAPTAAGRRRGRTLGKADFESLVQSLSSQVTLYLGAVPIQNGEGIVDLDTAKHNLDLLTVLEEKTAGNLSDTEQSALDLALYEGRTRFASVASRYIM